MADTTTRRPRVLVLTGAAYVPPDEVVALHKAGEAARVWLADVDGDLTFVDQRFLTDPPGRWRSLYRLLPIWAAQAIEAWRVRRRFDVIFCWGAETAAFPLAMLLKLTRARVPLVALFNWISPQKKARLLRLARAQFTKLVLPSSVQRRIAVERIGVAPDRVVEIPWCVDEDFWRPHGPAEQVTICSAGREMRDYETLVSALDGLDIPCHIAGALVPGKNDRWRSTLDGAHPSTTLPSNVSFGPLRPTELRDLYARSRFVVLPLYDSDTDNGTTCILEAWSMGRPVICSQTEGQRDVLEHGRTGLYVEPGDVGSLRKAIVALWQDPAEAARMGREARDVVEQHYPLRRFSDSMTSVLWEAAGLTLPRSQVLADWPPTSARPVADA